MATFPLNYKSEVNYSSYDKTDGYADLDQKWDIQRVRYQGVVGGDE
jgi:hypothetical protein